MEQIKACGIIICALIVIVVFKNLKSEFSLLIRLLITIIVFGFSLGIITPVMSYIAEISKDTVINQYMPILFKALGIGFAVQITADICNDAQESALAERICFLGKAEILVISLPLIKNLLELSKSLLK